MSKRYSSMSEVPEHVRAKLERFVTNVGGRTFAIHGLPSELTGGVLARYSRAQTGLQLTLVNEFLDENGEPLQHKGSELMERVLNAFGDDSVGELEGAHVGIEDISQLATKGLEDRRIGGSPIEQSTRYVRCDMKENGKWRYLRPKEIIESGFGGTFEKINDMAFEIYSKGIKLLSEHFRKEFGRGNQTIDVTRDDKRVKVHENELKNDEEKKAFDTAYNFTIRCAALDVGRCVLPTSTLTHIGIFGNGRFFTNVISSLKSSELAEERDRGCELEIELNKVIPTFIKRNRADSKIAERNQRMREMTLTLFSGIKPQADRVTLIPRTDYLDEITALCLFPYTNLSLLQINRELVKMPIEEKMKILDSYIGKRDSRRDRTGRSFEAGYPLAFDLVGCFAEYRDLERHRILTQQKQMLSTDLGFIMPPEMAVIGLEKEVEELVGMMSDLNSNLRHVGLEVASQYATLFNNRLRFMLGMNLREFQHLSELRTQPAGHFSYRGMVMEMATQVKTMYPWAEKSFGFVDYSDPNNRISRAKEQSRIAGKNLAAGIEGGIDLQ